MMKKMFCRGRLLLIPPVFEDEEQNRTASLLHAVSLILLLASITGVINSTLLGDTQVASALVIGTIGPLVSLWLTRRGRLRVASLFALLTILGVFDYLLYIEDGSHDVAILVYPGLAFAAAWLLDKRTFVVYVLLTTLSLLGIIYGELQGFIVNRMSEFTLHTDLIYMSIIMGITSVSAYFMSINSFKNATDARLSQQALAESNRELLRVNDELTRVNDELTREITERKQTEKERERLLTQVKEHAQRARKIVDTVPDGVCLLDAEWRVQLANLPAQVYLALLAEAEIGSVLTHLGERPLTELLTSPPKGLWHELVLDGSPRQTFEVIARSMESGAEIEGWVLVLRDVTKRREIEQYTQRQERLASVGQLAAGIAHDFNNIMATIILYVQMLSRALVLSSQHREQLAAVDQQAQHASDLIRQILDFGRNTSLERQPQCIASLMEEHIQLLRRTLPENIKIVLNYELDIDNDPLVVNADATNIKQVLMNLATNARDAMPGGGQLRIGLERIVLEPGEYLTPLEMETVRNRAWIRMTVSDTGTGIPSDVLPHIFEPFFTTKPAGKGTGLGLAQVWNIIQQHEGHIDVSTDAGGTTFSIYLPAFEISTAEAREQKTSALPQGNGETILVVEDNTPLRGALVENLEGLNYRTLAAVDGRNALDAFEQHREEVALVVSDVVMPDKGGVALLHALRDRDWNGPVVMLSGHLMSDEGDELQAHGVVAQMQKPMSLEQLAQTVMQALR